MKKLIKIDKNGSKHYIEDECPRCHGTGRYGTYGVCFKCGGSGKFEHTIIERTPEYEKVLFDKRIQRNIERARKQAPADNERLFKWNNLGENGDVYIVLGNTYNIKDELKEDGARFNRAFGWYFNKPYDKYPVEKIDGNVFLIEDEDTGRLNIDWDKAKEVADDIKKKYNDANKKVSTSEWIGEVGEKYSGTLKLNSVYTFISSFTDDLMGIYKFEDENENVFVWKTNVRDDLNENSIYAFSGKIKEHSEYRDEKQTVLTRCKYREI